MYFLVSHIDRPGLSLNGEVSKRDTFTNIQGPSKKEWWSIQARRIYKYSRSW